MEEKGRGSMEILPLCLEKVDGLNIWTRGRRRLNVRKWKSYPEAGENKNRPPLNQTG